jgi:hypothetical protein
MKSIIFILLLVLTASISFAGSEPSYEDTKMRAYILDNEENSFNIHRIKAKIILKNGRTIPTVTKRDYVINCNTNSYHVENSSTSYNGRLIDPFEKGEETKFTGSFPLKLKALYCGLNATDQPLEDTCEKQVYKNESERRRMMVQNKHYGTVVCK